MAEPGSYHATHTHNATVSWIALIVAVLALIIAWVAFNRSGTDLGEEVQQELNEIQVRVEGLEDDIRAGTADVLRGGADELDEGAADVETDNE